MASSGISIVLVPLLLATLCGGALAQSLSCTSALTSMAPCLNYITGNSPTPSSSCCSQLATVVQSSPQCLCSVLNGGGAPLGININQTLALQLPGACQVQTPPISQCKAATAPTTLATAPTTSATPPVNSPASSPVESTDETHAPAITPLASGTGSKAVPSTDGTSDGSTIKAPVHFMLFLLFIAFCGSSVTKF